MSHIRGTSIMKNYKFTRRNFIKGTSSLLFSSIPSHDLFAQVAPVQRLEWGSFKTTRNYASLIEAVARMKENTNAADKRSWTYWVNVHKNFCPHGLAYFLAWHRGYLFYFEQQLRAVSGNNSLVLPYWDYYTNPSVPPEFTNPASYNPLYVPRVNTDVSAALTLAPFANTVTDMQRGLTNAFESSLESMPHGPVHNIIGNVMADVMQSPIDPIFFLHHANIDRLWTAWQQGGGGRSTPPASNSYWNGNLTYATKLTLPRGRTIDIHSGLGYSYQNENMPASLPSLASSDAGNLRLTGRSGVPQMAQIGQRALSNPARLLLVQYGQRTAPNPPRRLSRPGIRRFTISPARMVGNAQSLGGLSRIALNEASVSGQLNISASSVDMLKRAVNHLNGVPGVPVTPYRSVLLTLDNVRIGNAGRSGGFFYLVYINLPPDTDVESGEAKYLVGTIGPFEIAGAMHRAHMNLEVGAAEAGTARLAFPLPAHLRELVVTDPGALTVSFVRNSGNTSPQGDVITVGEIRLELSRQDIQ
jgi:tyrosinase